VIGKQQDKCSACLRSVRPKDHGAKDHGAKDHGAKLRIMVWCVDEAR
jgi:hypothetical protein